MFFNSTKHELRRAIRLLEYLLTGQEQIMAGMKDYADQFTAQANELKDAVTPLAGAIDALEAKVTQAISNPDVPQDVQDQLTSALNDFKAVSDGIKAAVADAGDNTDEAATPPVQST
jgi:ferritin-like protein